MSYGFVKNFFDHALMFLCLCIIINSYKLATKTKIFCGCKNAFGAEVNTLCCPVCMGMPGTLPVLNKQVVDYAIKMGHALNCSINLY